MPNQYTKEERLKTIGGQVHRQCRQCEIWLPNDQASFYKKQAICITCKLANSKSLWETQDRAKRYGLGIDGYQSMLEAQDHQCAICQKPDHPLCVDHNHATGQVRGLLCAPCNKLLGWAKDSPETCLRAAHYLTTSKGNQ